MSHKESDIKSQSPSCIKWCKLDWGDKTIIIFLIIQGELINLSKALYKKIDRTQGAINWLTNQCTTKNNIYFGKDKNIELQPTKIQRDVFEYFLKNSGFTNHIYHNNLFLGWRAKKRLLYRKVCQNVIWEVLSKANSFIFNNFQASIR